MKKLFLILSIVLIFFSGCKEDAVTEPEEEYEITISGKVTEIDENGEHPSENALIRYKTQCAFIDEFLFDTTNQSGEFIFEIKKDMYPQTCLESFYLKVSKQGYLSFEHWFGNSQNKNISMQLTKIVNYFPLKVGNRWEYSKYSNAGDIYSNSWEGIEIWEITSIEGQNFDLDVFFTGSKTFYYTGTPTDTLFYENLKSSYKLKISEDGYLEPQENLGDMPFWHSRGEYIKISHSMSLDSIYIFDSIDNSNGISYTILMGIGIKNYEYKFFDGNSGKYYTLDLLNFSEGG